MAEQRVNVLLTTFAGLGLPRTLTLPVAASSTVSDVLETLHSRLPVKDGRLTITTTSNRSLESWNNEPISTLCSDDTTGLVPLRLSAPILGGKGGFGSQLRAAGGRMSSRKKRNQQNQPQNGSNRNLDGRRLRTVDAAKKLADYLAKKPDEEEREKEERRKRWENVVETATKREEDIKSGKAGSGGRLDAEYVEGKELAEDKTREAVIKAMREGLVDTQRTGSESSMDVVEEEESDEENDEESSGSSGEGAAEEQHRSGGTFFGWDDEDEDDEEDESEDDGGVSNAPVAYEGKGKAKAI